MTTTTARPFREGDIVRRKTGGRTFTLEDVNPNPDYERDEEYWASGWSRVGSEFVYSPDEIELVMDAEAAEARRAPSEAEIAAKVASALHSIWGESFSVTESSVSGGDIYVEADTAEGIAFSFNVRVSDVVEAI